MLRIVLSVVLAYGPDPWVGTPDNLSLQLNSTPTGDVFINGVPIASRPRLSFHSSFGLTRPPLVVAARFSEWMGFSSHLHVHFGNVPNHMPALDD